MGKAAPTHHTTSSVFDRLYDVLILKFCVYLRTDVMRHLSSKKLNVHHVGHILLKVLGGH